jgi:hypothetical protein
MRSVLIGMTHGISTHKLGRFIVEHKNVLLLIQRPSRVENLFGLSFNGDIFVSFSDSEWILLFSGQSYKTVFSSYSTPEQNKLERLILEFFFV